MVYFMTYFTNELQRPAASGSHRRDTTGPLRVRLGLLFIIISVVIVLLPSASGRFRFSFFQGREDRLSMFSKANSRNCQITSKLLGGGVAEEEQMANGDTGDA